ncbi:two-component sensor histidine kinase [Roseateles sp. DAIF2]|uniref:sensor histidine kinase n=1 Tax=Roseateles sp. DAIF2 TaxID=2714952 RepID=UPI0018A28BEE|nr:ATP-binding protein [Roseateles sp. DAIF2]QPF73198.1 two-component sensor histidine kinase [Roseateles sp. DAIF2]
MTTATAGGSRRHAAVKLWRWISLRMISLALAALLLVSGGMWYRHAWWDAKLRAAIPEPVRLELQALEEDPGSNRQRLRQIYGEYLYGEYFSKEVIRADLLFFAGLILVALPMIIAGGLWVSLRLSRQLGVVAEAAGEIARGRFSSRAQLVPNIPSALQHLTLDFNRMAAQLERYERELQESSAVIAHELRTPLTAAKGRLQGLIDGVFGCDAGNLALIMRQLDQLNHLVDDVYLLSMAGAGQLALKPSRFPLRLLLEERIAWVLPALREHGMEISLQLDGALRISADRDRLGQVISILIDNAMRYASTGGSLVLRAWLQEDDLVLVADDRGPGFAPEHLDRVSDRFWRAEHSRSRHAGGAGLGLAIAAAICTTHGGQLSAHNRSEGGARLRICLPGQTLSDPELL